MEGEEAMKRKYLPHLGPAYWECVCGYSNNTERCWMCQEPKERKPATKERP